jgi:hypothetical protein
MRVNLKGQQFGRLTVLREAGQNKHGHLLWFCHCKCRNRLAVTTSNLRSGNTRSCGCLYLQSTSRVGALNRIHGHSARKSPTYISWQSMKQRCLNPNYRSRSYKRYMGVKIAPEWLKFEGFLASMGERPKGTSLSRFGDVGSYEPGNCAWHTLEQQWAERRKKLSQKVRASCRAA